MISSKSIVLDIDHKNKYELIREMANKMKAAGNIEDVEVYVNAVFKREAICPTCPGFSVAIPHAKSEAVKHACVVFYRLKNPLKWCDKSEETVRLVFQIAVPEPDVDQAHLKMLANLSRHLMNPSFREKLLTLKMPEEVESLLKNIM